LKSGNRVCFSHSVSPRIALRSCGIYSKSILYSLQGVLRTLRKVLSCGIYSEASECLPPINESIINLVGYGITNPADGNSLSYTTFSALSGQTISHYSLSKISIDYEKYRYILTTVTAFFWICILLLVVVFILKKEDKEIKYNPFVSHPKFLSVRRALRRSQ